MNLLNYLFLLYFCEGTDKQISFKKEIYVDINTYLCGIYDIEFEYIILPC